MEDVVGGPIVGSCSILVTLSCWVSGSALTGRPARSRWRALGERTGREPRLERNPKSRSAWLGRRRLPEVPEAMDRLAVGEAPGYSRDSDFPSSACRVAASIIVPNVAWMARSSDGGLWRKSTELASMKRL